MTNPARKLKRSAVKNIVRFPAIKANKGNTILVESLLESNYCLHLKFSKTVKSYKPQPKTFRLTGPDEEITFTPDFEVELTTGERGYVELKPAQKSESDYYRNVFDCFHESLLDTNLTFKVVTENEICIFLLIRNLLANLSFRGPINEKTDTWPVSSSFPRSRNAARGKGLVVRRNIHSRLVCYNPSTILLS